MKPGVVVAAVQMPFTWAVSPQEYFDRIGSLVSQAAHVGAKLVVLPEHSGDMLLGMQFPFATEAPYSDLWKTGPFSSWADCVRQTSATTAQFFVHTFEALASRYELYIIPGTLCLPDCDPDRTVGPTDPVYRAAFIFGPDGQVIAEQRQLQVEPEDSSQLSAGDNLGVITTDFGRISILIGDDAHSPTAHNTLKEQNVEIVVRVGATPAKEWERVRRDLRSLAKSGHIFALDAQLSGGDFGGQSGIYAGNSEAGIDDSVLVMAQMLEAIEIVCATLR